MMEKDKFTTNGSKDLKNVSRDIVSYFTKDEAFEEALSDERSKEYQIFNLAVQYLDNEKNNERDEIAEKLKKLLGDF